MPSKYPQYFLSCPIANEGDKTIPPETSQSAGTGRLSQEKGWTDVNAQPIAEGGIPPQREDFNGALFLLSQLLFWMQQGGLFNYSTSFDYEVGNEVLLGGVKYRCIQANGPSSTTVSPTASNGAQYWSNQDVGSVRYDKAQSLSVLLEEIGMTKNEMIAIGDGFNDLSMIQYAGLGIAMENAQDVVKQAADFITLSNEEDGVAYAVEKFYLDNSPSSL